MDTIDQGEGILKGRIVRKVRNKSSSDLSSLERGKDDDLK